MYQNSQRCTVLWPSSLQKPQYGGRLGQPLASCGGYIALHQYFRVNSRDYSRNSQQGSTYMYLAPLAGGLLNGGHAVLEQALVVRHKGQALDYFRMNSRDYLRNSQWGSLNSMSLCTLS